MMSLIVRLHKSCRNAAQSCPLCTVVCEVLTDEKIVELGSGQHEIRCFVDISSYSIYLELSNHPEGSSPLTALRTSELLGQWELEDYTDDNIDSGMLRSLFVYLPPLFMDCLISSICLRVPYDVLTDGHRYVRSAADSAKTDKRKMDIGHHPEVDQKLLWSRQQ